jgi:hypothetical protein
MAVRLTAYAQREANPGSIQVEGRAVPREAQQDGPFATKRRHQRGMILGQFVFQQPAVFDVDFPQPSAQCISVHGFSPMQPAELQRSLIGSCPKDTRRSLRPCGGPIKVAAALLSPPKRGHEDLINAPSLGEMLERTRVFVHLGVVLGGVSD